MRGENSAGVRIARHVFTREQMAGSDFGSFAAAHSPETMPPEALRKAHGSLVLGVSGFEGDPRAPGKNLAF